MYNLLLDNDGDEQDGFNENWELSSLNKVSLGGKTVPRLHVKDYSILEFAVHTFRDNEKEWSLHRQPVILVFEVVIACIPYDLLHIEGIGHQRCRPARSIAGSASKVV